MQTSHPSWYTDQSDRFGFIVQPDSPTWCYRFNSLKKVWQPLNCSISDLAMVNRGWRLYSAVGNCVTTHQPTEFQTWTVSNSKHIPPWGVTTRHCCSCIPSMIPTISGRLLHKQRCGPETNAHSKSSHAKAWKSELVAPKLVFHGSLLWSTITQDTYTKKKKD